MKVEISITYCWFFSLGTPKRPLHITQEARFLVFRPASKQQATGRDMARSGSSMKLLERVTSHDHSKSLVRDFKKLFPVQKATRGSRSSERQRTIEQGLSQQHPSQQCLSQQGPSQQGLPQLLKALPTGVRKSYTASVQLPLIVNRSQS